MNTPGLSIKSGGPGADIFRMPTFFRRLFSASLLLTETATTRTVWRMLNLPMSHVHHNAATDETFQDCFEGHAEVAKDVESLAKELLKVGDFSSEACLCGKAPASGR